MLGDPRMNSVDARNEMVEALRLDLVGPCPGHAFERELLTDPPHIWYLSGFLVPTGASASDKQDETADEELDLGTESGGTDDMLTPEKKAAKRPILPSSFGITVLVPPETVELNVTVHWGDYEPEYEETKHLQEDGKRPKIKGYRRTPRRETLAVRIPKKSGLADDIEVPGSRGLKLQPTVRALPSGSLGPDRKDDRAVTVFLVNRREPETGPERYRAYAFQACIEVESAEPLTPRPNLRGVIGDGGRHDTDEKIADLQYRDVVEYAVGHGVSVKHTACEDRCHHAETTWIPTAKVERVVPAELEEIELGMEALGTLEGYDDARSSLDGLVKQYRQWIEGQEHIAASFTGSRRETCDFLVTAAKSAANRIEAGIALLEEPTVLQAFTLANRAIARAARQRNWFTAGKQGTPDQQKPPRWRPFQLAFLLQSIRGIVHPTHDDREVVDLLFFPTGGGKTEAYLGLAAFTMVLRRLRNPGASGCGLSVLMRYTLRLLTLDQLGRAAGVICALELERAKNPALGDWPFEIGLWVGRAATPNRLGRVGDNDPHCAYRKLRKYRLNDKEPSPIPLEECPWCGSKFTSQSFRLVPNEHAPLDLRVHCSWERCEFSGATRYLPILAVDEPIYRRLPAFMIATVDKFAALPWTGETGALFGLVQRHDRNGFYGPCDPGQGAFLGPRLPPPDLIIQDELHLISGPLGTIAGLYEAAIDKLCTQEVEGTLVRPKIVASTATVRKAEDQIRALFDRQRVQVFPPPGQDRADSFFAKTVPDETEPARLYVGVAAQGRSLKVLLLRCSLILLSRGQALYDRAKRRNEANPVDPYMTLLAYFNSLRELGGSRRIIEDEVYGKLQNYSQRKRLEPEDTLFANRDIDFDVMELNSRVSTARVADAKRKLTLEMRDKGSVDVALATNMISVGLDIQRLGLMLMFGQPKASAEYIQATSRVGRDRDRPGLVVTVLNIHKPRDRSHYERFESYHNSFYRSVEATSVTPFSPRALDRALPAALVALCRHGIREMTPPLGADEIKTMRSALEEFARLFADRAKSHRAAVGGHDPEKLRLSVLHRATALLDDWLVIDKQMNLTGVKLGYSKEERGNVTSLISDFLDPELEKLPEIRRRFRANRSMRDVESMAELNVKMLNDWEFRR